MKRNTKTVASILSSVDVQLKKQNSTKRVFMQGLVRGFGTALGATVLVAIATSIAIQLASSFDMLVFLDSFFGSASE